LGDLYGGIVSTRSFPSFSVPQSSGGDLHPYHEWDTTRFGVQQYWLAILLYQAENSKDK
jgi:hypothetical protein